MSIEQLSSIPSLNKERLKIIFHGHPEAWIAVRRVQGISLLIKSIASEVESKLALVTPVDVVQGVVMPMEGHTVRSCDFCIKRSLACMVVPVNSVSFGTVKFAYTESEVGRGFFSLKVVKVFKFEVSEVNLVPLAL